MDKQASIYRHRLVIFAKAPQLGQVKTRLAQDMGQSAATNWYRTNCGNVVRRLARDTRWLTYLAVTSLLVAVALLGIFVPARRATQVDPVETLRSE